MTRKVILSRAVDKWLRKADARVARSIRDAIRWIAAAENPRVKGKALTGNLAGLWRYRVGDYRIVCRLDDAELMVLVLRIGHRSSVYRASRNQDSS